MEISQIRSAMPFLFPNGEKEAMEAGPRSLGDTVDIKGLNLIPDEEVDNVLNETINMIGADSVGALSVHSGLTESRVFALLGL